MAKAKSIHNGDWIRVGGKTVRVTNARTQRDGKRRIGWKGKGSQSGQLERDVNADVTRVYGTGWPW